MSSPSGPVVVVVDDDEAVRRSLKFCLELEGFRVRLYGSAEDLLAAADLPSRGCLVVDYHMAALDGLALIARLRDRRSRLPAILITAKPTAEMHRRALTAGCREVLEKPLEDGALLDSIRSMLAEERAAGAGHAGPNPG